MIKKGCLFLDIGRSRLLGGYVPESGIPSVEFISLENPNTDYEENLCAEIIKLLMRLKNRHKTNQVILILGSEKLTFSYMKEVYISKTPTKISKSLIAKMKNNSIKRAISDNKIFICDMVKGMSIDGASYIGLPEDKKLKGRDIVLESFIATAGQDYINLIRTCIKRAKCKVMATLSRDLIVSSQAINKRQKHDGAIFLTIDNKKASAIFYYQGIIQRITLYPFGSEDITSAVMKEFGLPFSVAKHIQNHYIDVDILKKTYSNEKINFTKNNKKYSVNTSELCKIVEQGIKNICSGIKNDILAWEAPLDKCRIYITGDITMLNGFLETAEYIFSMPVELAYCKNQSCIQLAGALMPYAIIPGALWHSISCGELPKQTLREKLWAIWNDLWNLF